MGITVVMTDAALLHRFRTIGFTAVRQDQGGISLCKMAR